MPLEIEAKMHVVGFTDLRSRLKKAGGKLHYLRDEQNTFFDNPQASFRRHGKGLRLRANRDIRTGRTTYVITVKGPVRKGKMKARPEFEFTVDDPRAVVRAFKELGMEICMQFKKRRESWMLRGCEVELDTLPGLGSFIEIEGPNTTAIEKIRRRLGLADHPLIRKSYAALMAAHRKGKRSKIR